MGCMEKEGVGRGVWSHVQGRWEEEGMGEGIAFVGVHWGSQCL